MPSLKSALGFWWGLSEEGRGKGCFGTRRNEGCRGIEIMTMKMARHEEVMRMKLFLHCVQDGCIWQETVSISLQMMMEQGPERDIQTPKQRQRRTGKKSQE